MKKRLLWLAVLLIAAGSAAIVIQRNTGIQTYRNRTDGDGEWKLVWSDEFEGDSLNPAYWNQDVGKGYWGNEELEYYTAGENLAVRDGCLELTARYQPDAGEKTYTSARINTAYKVQVRYGRIEARIKLPVGQGMWPAFWMTGTDRDGVWPWCGEIDILEAYGNFRAVQGTLIWPRPKPENREDYWLILRDGYGVLEAPEDWHVYAVEWSEGKVEWFLDGEAYHVQEFDPKSEEMRPFRKPFSLLLNAAVGGTLGGEVDHSIFPKTMYVDYVRIYSR